MDMLKYEEQQKQISVKKILSYRFKCGLIVLDNENDFVSPNDGLGQYIFSSFKQFLDYVKKYGEEKNFRCFIDGDDIILKTEYFKFFLYVSNYDPKDMNELISEYMNGEIELDDVKEYLIPLGLMIN